MLSNRPSTNLADVLHILVEKMGWQEEYELSIIINEWETLVGQKFAAETKPDTLKNGILTVNSESSVWRAELFYRRHEIIDKISKLRNKEVVKEMVIR
jgi:predicted nucleic acid-binding Zn ribbon protein